MTGRDPVKSTVRILGLDPGSRITGFGVIDVTGQDLEYVTSGCIRTRSDEFVERLREIYAAGGEIVREQRPQEIAIERVFMHRNADSALKLGHARATALAASFESGIPIHEYAAREIKQAVVGTGGADKAQVQHMVKKLLGIDGKLQADAADALGVAICHAHQRRNQHLLDAGVGKRRRR